MAIVAVVLVGLGLVTAPAQADGPSGSHEEDEVQRCIDDASGQEVERNADGTCPSGSTDTTFVEWDNQVTCGSGEDVGGLFVLYAGANGAEACSAGGGLPVQGRIIATSEDGGYLAADGDADNAPEAQGWIRIDGGGVHCGAADGDLDATHPAPGDTSDNCG
jgi:hypothetical protein